MPGSASIYDVAELLPPLPLNQVLVDRSFALRSLFRDGVTGIAGDRVWIYHVGGRELEGTAPAVEVTTYVAGGWIDDRTLRSMVVGLSGALLDCEYTEIDLTVDGKSERFQMAANGSKWAARSLGLDPVVTITGRTLEPAHLSLEWADVNEIEGRHRFG